MNQSVLKRMWPVAFSSIAERSNAAPRRNRVGEGGFGVRQSGVENLANSRLECGPVTGIC
jgi:hypothetical protein